MTSSLNLNNITVDENGRVRLGGLSSGIDVQGIVDATITARRVPAVQIESTIETNTQQLTSFEELKTLSTTFTSVLDDLRGSTSFFANDVFQNKTGFFSATSASGAPASHTPTDPSFLLSATIDDSAATANHTLQINQIAKAQSIRSDAFTSKTNALVNDQGLTAGVININGTDITLAATDTLLDLRDKINNANANINATIVTVSDTEHYLVVNSSETGLANAMTIASNAAPVSVAVGNGGFENTVLVDGAVEGNVDGWSESGTTDVVNPTSSTLSSVPEGNNVLRLGASGVVAETTGETIEADTLYKLSVDVAQAIGDSGGQYTIELYADDGMGGFTQLGSGFSSGAIAAGDTWETANLVIDTADYAANVGEALRVRLVSDSGTIYMDNVQIEKTTEGAAEGLGLIQNAAIKTELTTAQDANLTVNGIQNVTRSSNQIDDVIDGVTFSLNQAEPDTEITLGIETDLNSVKTALIEFVEAYNALRDFYDNQRTEVDRDTLVDADGDGDATNDEELGVLANDTTLRSLMNKLATEISLDKPELADGYRSLSQIGITINEDFRLEVDDSTLDSRLISDVDEVRKLFAANVTSSDPRLTYVVHQDTTVEGTYYLNISGTDGDGNILGGNISTTPGAGTADDGSFVASGMGVTASDVTTAEGLNVIFDAGASSGPIADVQITVSRGLADQLYYYFNDLTKLDGTIDDLSENLAQRNATLTTRVEDIDARLEILRISLEQKYIAMEIALAELDNLSSTIDGFFNNEDS